MWEDTDPKIVAKMIEMMQMKTPEERLMMGFSMLAFSKKMVINAIKRENPQISPAGLRRELFLKFYGNDFNPVQRQKILAHFG